VAHDCCICQSLEGAGVLSVIDKRRDLHPRSDIIDDCGTMSIGGIKDKWNVFLLIGLAVP